MRKAKHEALYRDALVDLNADVEAAKLAFDSSINPFGNLKGFIQDILQDPFGYILVSHIQVNILKCNL